MSTAVMNPTTFQGADAASGPNNVPATAGNNAGAMTAGQGGDAGGAAPGTGMVVAGGPMAQMRQVLQQPTVKKSMPAIVALMTVVILALAYSWMQAPQSRTLLPGLQGADLQTAYESLQQGGFGPHIDDMTGQLRVPQSRFHEARIFLAGQGIPKEPISGLSALSEQNAMTTSQFMEQARYNAAIEQELARSIGQISGVQHARVHLATPKQSVFVRDRTPPKASVVITRYSGRSVSDQQVQAIVHLVSSSIPYLMPEDVTVVDNFGNLMTQSPDSAPLGLTSAQAEHKRTQEELLRTRVVEILSPVVGEANVRSQVNLTLDFTQVESTTEDYDRGGNGPRTRSEVMAEDRSANMDAAGVPGATTNTPPANASVTQNTGITPGEGGGVSNIKSSRTTRNYELDKSVQHVKNAQGGVSRMTVAVVINERAVVVPEDAEVDPAAPTSVPYTDQELERMLNLVRGVVGYNEARGDNVTIMPAKFEPVAPLEPMVPWYQDDLVINSFKSGLMTILLLVFLIIVVRPVIKNLIGITPEEAAARALAEAAGTTPPGELSEEEMNMIQIGEGESLEDIKAKLRPKKSSISADMLDTANTYDDKVALIRMLVAEDSGRVANVLKRMIKAS